MIDIIIPAYNSYNTIEITLNSINKQSVKDLIEVYIIDDCSKKTYDYLINKFNNINITIYRMSQNKGPGTCRNKGLDISNNDYIFFLDSDDEIIKEDSLERMLDCFKNDNNIDIVSGVVESINGRNQTNYILNQERCLHAKLYKRSFIDKYKFRFNDEVSYRHEDYAFHYLCLYAKPNLYIIDYPIYRYNNTNESLTKSKDVYTGFKSYELLCKNTLWSIKEAEKRNFDIKIVVTMLNQTLMYLYFTYEIYYNEIFKDELLLWTKELILYYNNNRKIIDHDKISKRNYDMFSKIYKYEYHTSWESFINTE